MATSRDDTMRVPPHSIPDEWTPVPLELPLDEPLGHRPSGGERPQDPDAGVGNHVIVIDVA